jgi:hypothetical protein
MKSRFFIFIFLGAFIFSCDEDESIDPLKKELIGTVWTIDRIEIFNPADELIRTIEIAPDAECFSYLNFKSKDYIVTLDDCALVGCGEWQVNENEIEFLIAIPNLASIPCSSQNLRTNFYVNDVLTLTNDSLMIEGWGATLIQIYKEADWEDLRQAFLMSQIKIKTYYFRVDHDLDLPYQPSCCRTLEWI